MIVFPRLAQLSVQLLIHLNVLFQMHVGLALQTATVKANIVFQFLLIMLVMNPLDTSTSDMFSTFSIADICLELQDKLGTSDCLLDSIPPSVGAGICGNGVKEGNEECDCGSDCANSSCCTTECKLKAGSVCADENDSCCSGCKLLVFRIFDSY